MAVGLRTKYPREAYRLWFWVMYAALIAKPRAPRPRLPIVVIDGQDNSFREAHDLVAHRFYKSFWRRQPYIDRGKPWFLGGSLHHKSEFLPFIQMADLVANASRHAITNRPPYRSWYDTPTCDSTLRRSAMVAGLTSRLTRSLSLGSALRKTVAAAATQKPSWCRETVMG